MYAAGAQPRPDAGECHRVMRGTTTLGRWGTMRFYWEVATGSISDHPLILSDECRTMKYCESRIHKPIWKCAGNMITLYHFQRFGTLKHNGARITDVWSFRMYKCDCKWYLNILLGKKCIRVDDLEGTIYDMTCLKRLIFNIHVQSNTYPAYIWINYI